MFRLMVLFHSPSGASRSSGPCSAHSLSIGKSEAQLRTPDPRGTWPAALMSGFGELRFSLGLILTDTCRNAVVPVSSSVLLSRSCTRDLVLPKPYLCTSPRIVSAQVAALPARAGRPAHGPAAAGAQLRCRSGA